MPPKASKPSALAEVRERELGDFGTEAMRIYGTEVNEGRAIPSLQDGLKPVARRILWAASKIARDRPTKTARVVGDVIGKWHPHGDAAVVGAISTMVNAPTPILRGVGNWGTLIDPCAAMRYTNVGLTKYGTQFVARNYLPVTKFIPNYDDQDVEPVYLPALLPNVLMNGDEGIGVGVATTIPAFTPASLIPVIIRLLNKEELSPIDYAKALKFHCNWGGEMVNTKANRQALVGLMTSPSATIQFDAPFAVERDLKRISLTKFAPGLNIEKMLTTIKLWPEVEKVYSGKGLSWFIQVKKTINFVEFDKVVERVKRVTTTKQSFSVFVSDREYIEEDGKQSVKVRFHRPTVPQLILMWIKFRIQLEKDSLDWQISETEKRIAYLKLLIHACDHLDVIFAALRKADPATHISKGLRVSLEQANQILDLKVRQLSKLDQDKLKEDLKEVQDHLANLQSLRKRPAGAVKAYLEKALDTFNAQPNKLAVDKANIQWWLEK